MTELALSRPEPPAASARAFVSLRDVHKSFGTVQVINGVSLDVARGQTICIIGPSGSGKSTLIRCINALVAVNSGSITVDGIEVNDPKQDKAEVEARAHALLKKVRLSGKEASYPGELSGGQQQRVAIARALAMRPEVMLFDEVTAALDPETKKEVLFTIQELAKDGMTCIVVTHEMGFAREVADHIYFTEGGLIVEHAPPADFFGNPKDPRTREFLSQVL